MENTKERQEVMLTVEATDDNLDAVWDFVDRIVSSVPCSAMAKTKLEVAVEEIFVNISSYAYGEGRGQAVIRGSISSELPWVLTLVFEDEGKEFNPLQKEPPDLTPAVRQRTVGGLGIFLARNMVDEISYERREGKNVLTIKKNMAE